MLARKGYGSAVAYRAIRDVADEAGVADPESDDAGDGWSGDPD
jgi:hypothetical protein